MRKTKKIIAVITAVSLSAIHLIPVTYTPVYAEKNVSEGDIQFDFKYEERDETEIPGVPDKQKDCFSYTIYDDHIIINSYTGKND